MSDHSVVHATFHLERLYNAAPARVFAALSTEAGKAAWFSGDRGEWELIERSLDFRVGGHERLAGRWPSGLVTDYRATYHDIVENARIVYAYDMFHGDRKLSVSLASWQLAPEGTGTRVQLTEQGAFLDGYDDAGSREHGTNVLMDRLGAALSGDPLPTLHALRGAPAEA
jgi:uncharacterized protein YndB with AHSA1/START domain